MAAAAGRHHVRKTGHKPARVSEQFRNPDNGPSSDDNVYALCGNLPGPCQWKAAGRGCTL